jgi:PTH2 family peptidyl-tRNA hydrolase
MPKKGEMQYKLVVVVRDDIKMSVGKLAAQVAHAAVTCAFEAKSRKPKWFSEWLKEGQRKVVLRAEDIDQLRALKDKAMSAGLPNAMITDAGLTELAPNTITCLGIGPAPENFLDPITGSLQLA